jgi:hypothetical protein
MRCQMTEGERSYLRMFTPDTYGINFPREVARNLEAKGLIELVSPKLGTTLYAITEAGRRTLVVPEVTK